MLHPDRGFTVLEVMVALALTAVVLLSARLLTDAIFVGTGWLEADAAEADRLANGMRMLALAVASAEADGRPGGEFQGAGDAVQFRTTLTLPSGMPQPATLRLRLAGDRVELTGVPGDPLLIAPGVNGFRLDYRSGLGERAAWLQGWVSASEPPAAIRMRLGTAAGTDTLIFVIGERG